MKSFLENIYMAVPSPCQNLLVSLYGIKLQFNRYGGIYETTLNEAMQRERVGREAVLAYAESMLIHTIAKAVKNVPYYRELFKEQNLSLNDIKSFEDIKKIPLLEKQVLRENPQKLVDGHCNAKRLQVVHTTGTTGSPLKIYCNDRARQKNYAYFDRFLINAGIDPKGKKATLGGRVIVPPSQAKKPFWRYSYYQNNLLFSSYHLSDENIPLYIKKLYEFQPHYIDAYPSSIFFIADYAARNCIDLTGITSNIVTSAETLFDEQRAVIESVFDAHVFDQYGAAEMCVSIGQCQSGNYHVYSDYGFLEFLREDGSDALPGEEAELVCTGYINEVMPLIRYRIGDKGVLSTKNCNCGSPFPVLEKLVGRIDDMILTPEGKRIGRLSPVLKGFPVREAQYIQESIDKLEVWIVKDELYNKRTEADVLKELRKRLGNSMEIQIKYVSAIPRGKGGKLRSVISLL
ncbi:phenylacetate-CoA ligase [Desulfosalsimonas propionicica]|uniref:Phenylacetate-CoA ligase n=1 Tax=Desulfosalsimonas propionicica TaxID=332175 RepID=A0A7W0CC15_9BACT|nr:phenylacetate--CoA ligase family protein [Desulfosalsimonas propionicica]MBA2882997.1 phenylacetate-CoA ligase [Desulfosalsimonas propionicica]